MRIRVFLTTLAFWLLSFLNTTSQVRIVDNTNINKNNYSLNQRQWIEQQIQQMTPEERIGQLFMLAAYSNKDFAHQKNIEALIKQYNIGGLIFMQGEPKKQAQMTNTFQQSAKVPLLIAIDGEWGLSMRLKNTTRFPRQLTLGAIQDNQLIRKMGGEIARQCKRMGIHVNFAPVVDVNNNPKNPVINDRSFGENKYNVSEKGIAYMQGMEQNGILACAKHFPGHGDTDADSHHTLPTIKHDLARLRDIELYPFRQMAQRGVGGMMIAHLAIPALDNTPISQGASLTTPTTLSKAVVTDLLKNELGYKGLVFTDALNMKGVSKFFPPGIVDVKALLAGNDVLLFSQNVGRAMQEIKNAIQQGQISQDEIDARVRKILKAKYRVGLHQNRPIPTANLMQDLNRKETDVLKQQLIENALTLAKDDKRLIPFRQLDKKTFASLSIGVSTLTDFQGMLNNYAKFRHHTLKSSATTQEFNDKFNALRDYNTVVVSVHDMNKRTSKNYGLNKQAITFIRQLQQVTDVVLVVFGSPYSLANFPDSKTVLVAYEDNNISQSMSAQSLFGGISLKGKLPVTASEKYRYGQGITTAGGVRLKYTMPEEVGFDSRQLKQIDAIAQEAITAKATPGCQVLVAKDGKVIFQKSYGHHTYQRRIPVKNEDVYDIASITKIAGSMLGVMEMYEKQHFSLQSTLGNVLNDLQGTNKANLVIKDILTHQSGLIGWIPFYKETLAGKEYAYIYKNECTDNHGVEVAKNLYMSDNFQRVMWNRINESDLGAKKYKYSDVGYYYFREMIHRYSGMTMDRFLEKRYYAPLGLPKMRYNPRQQYSTYGIVPTENDKEWRKQVVHGHVHDMGAAMLGGVGGHAGLFATANDLAIIMQMLMNGGSYGGLQYFNESTIKTFTSYQDNKSRRGLGFDKPTQDQSDGPTSKLASRSTFGHTGFTGTGAWADPETGLIYIFLSNRVYPKARNWKLNSKNIRTRIHDVIYQADRSSRVKEWGPNY